MKVMRVQRLGSVRRARSPKDPNENQVPYLGSRFARMRVRISEHLVMITATLLSIAPLYFMAITAFKSRGEFEENPASLAPATDPTFENFRTVWTRLDFGLQMQNSFILSASSAVIVTVLSVMGGFALAHIKFRGAKWILIATIVLMSVPAIVIVIPLFLIMVDLQLINTFPSAIIVEAGLGLPFGIYMMFTFMRGLPSELFRAAQMEGAGYWRQLIWIATPLSVSAIGTVALVTSVMAWNDLLVPLIMWQSEDLRVLMVGLAGLSPGRQGGVDVPIAMAGVTISVLPMIILFLITRRFFVRGLVDGAVK